MLGSYEESTHKTNPTPILIDRLPAVAPHTFNELLGQLPADCRKRVFATADRVLLNKRQVILERNVRLRFAYFLESGAASLFARAGADCSNVEIRTLGAGDFVGLPLVLGADMSPHRCIVHVAGEAIRIPAEQLTSLLEDIPELRQILLRYVHTALVHSSQLIACNAKHSLRERLARWLLVASDRLGSNDITLTHEGLGRAISVRRAGVTAEIGGMELGGLIRRHRGCVSIVDRRGLENASCSCYRVLRSAKATKWTRQSARPGSHSSDQRQCFPGDACT